MNSIWTETAKRPEFETLNGDCKTEVLIVGGGIVGILCAYMMQKAGVPYILVEADKICGGITKNTTAKITLQHGLIYDKIIRKYGIERAELYLKANSDAIDKYCELCKDIDCDFSEQDAYVYSMDKRTKIEDEVRAYQTLGVNAEFYESIPLPFSVDGAVKIKNQAQFNPLKFLFEIAKNLNIKENTKVIEFTPDAVITNRGKIRAKSIIIATHFPIINKHGNYFLKMYQHRSYVLALKNAQKLDGMYVDESDKGLSFRNHNNYLILGGGGHRTGKKGGNWHELEEFAKEHYSHSKIEYRWATQDCKTLDGIAYIGRYSKSTPNLYVATGFNKWGMTTAMVAANILTDAVQGTENIYAKAFSTDRTILHPQLAINAAESIINLITPTVPRCPHLGCALKYNKAEHSWDCPCHGSRFSEDGTLIDNPATDDKKPPKL